MFHSPSRSTRCCKKLKYPKSPTTCLSAAVHRASGVLVAEYSEPRRRREDRLALVGSIHVPTYFDDRQAHLSPVASHTPSSLAAFHSAPSRGCTQRSLASAQQSTELVVFWTRSTLSRDLRRREDRPAPVGLTLLESCKLSFVVMSQGHPLCR